MRIDQIIDGIIEREGGYVDHPADRGGPTRWGITEATARDCGYDGEMQDLPQALARRIYRTRYYEKPGFERVSHLSSRIADELTDTGVNMGTRRASRFLQRALKAFGDQGMVVDGIIGTATVRALQDFLAQRAGQGGELIMLRALDCQQGACYLDIVEHDPRQGAFVFGWFAHRIGQA